MTNWCLFCSVSYVDRSECRDEVDVDRNTNLKKMIRKYFEQEHSIVNADMKEVVVVVVVVVGISSSNCFCFWSINNVYLPQTLDTETFLCMVEFLWPGTPASLAL